MDNPEQLIYFLFCSFFISFLLALFFGNYFNSADETKYQDFDSVLSFKKSDNKNAPEAETLPEMGSQAPEARGAQEAFFSSEWFITTYNSTTSFLTNAREHFQEHFVEYLGVNLIAISLFMLYLRYFPAVPPAAVAVAPPPPPPPPVAPPAGPLVIYPGPGPVPAPHRLPPVGPRVLPLIPRVLPYGIGAGVPHIPIGAPVLPAAPPAPPASLPVEDPVPAEASADSDPRGT